MPQATRTFYSSPPQRHIKTATNRSTRYIQREMALHKSLFRRLKNVLPLSITIVLLFYYTFRNEIDILNSFAETNHVPTTVETLQTSAKGTHEELSVDDLLDKNRFYPLLVSNKDIDPFQDPRLLTSKGRMGARIYPVLNKVEVPVHMISSEKVAPIQSDKLVQEGAAHDMLDRVRNLFLKSYSQLKNQKNLYENPLNWPIDLIDTLDTLHIMNLTNEFDDLVDNVIAKINFKNPTISMKEDEITFIDVADISQRVLSSMISAFDLSKNQVLLNKARDLADYLLTIFDTPNGLPLIDYPVNSKLVNRFPYREINPARLTSMTVEFVRLTHLLKEDKYFNAAYHIYKTIAESTDQFAINYLFPNIVDPSGCELLTDDEIKQGKHLKSNILKTIDENYKFAFCKQTNGLARSEVKVVRDVDRVIKTQKRKQVITLDGTTIPLYQNLIKIMPMLKNHDILRLHEITFEEEDGVIGKRDKIVASKEDNSLLQEKNDVRLLSSKGLFFGLMQHVRDLMIYRPITPLKLDNGEAPLFLSSIETYTRYIPTSNELEIEMLRQFDHKSDACSFASMMIYGAKLFEKEKDFDFQLLGKEVNHIAAELAESCYKLSKEFKGYSPSHILFDPCLMKEKEGRCIFDENEKIQKIVGGYYKSDIASSSDEEDVDTDKDHHLAVKVKNDKNSNTKANSKDPQKEYSRRVMLFSKKESPGHLLKDVNKNSIDVGSKKWKNHPDWPLWLNKMDQKHLLASDTILSILHMYRITGDSIWRDRGFDLFEELERSIDLKAAGPKGLWKLTEEGHTQGEYPSTWLSQTLKFYYLLGSKPDDVSLDNYVISMGGHLIGIN